MGPLWACPGECGISHREASTAHQPLRGPSRIPISATQLTLQSGTLSIKGLTAPPLPRFAVLIGRNGVGKTQLLDGIKSGWVSTLDEGAVIEKYDIASFKPPSSEPATWGGSVAASNVAHVYFHGSGSEVPADIAAAIYKETVKSFDLPQDSDSRARFTVHLKNAMDAAKVSKLDSSLRGISGNAQIDDAIEFYTNVLARRVISQFHGQPTGEPRQTDDRHPVMLTLAMRLRGKLAHELDQSDFLRAAHHTGETIANTLSEAFTRYKVDQYSWAHSEGEIPGRGEIATLMQAYRTKHKPPWETLREILSQMREQVGDGLFDFEFSDPEHDQFNHATHNQYSFRTTMTNRSTGDSYDLHTLSSGESILMCLCLIWFDQELGRARPDLLLLDELDALLHPSMVSALVACLKQLFVANGTRVLMATHCASTVAALNDNEIFRVTRLDGHLKLRPVSRSEAVEDLSDGIATLDTGLRIATSRVAPVTIVSEGKNYLHLRRWAELHFPGEVDVFEKLPHRTSATELQSYARILSTMHTNSHLLFVWDCDKADVAHKLSNRLPSTAKLTAFALGERDNPIAPNGIENKYDAGVLKPFSLEVSGYKTGDPVRHRLDSDRKTELAEHIAQHGTEHDFRHFDDLHTVVIRILNSIQAECPAVPNAKQ